MLSYAVFKRIWIRSWFQLGHSVISDKFWRAEIKSFQSDVDEGSNNFETILFHM